ncbi:MAG: CDP-alcohol phosphatidyltransferase family protein [Candidatus Lokiarchaeota archaeon]|nr:CDP-alcohol phosphatidyltransferase family protein [Candidatus Lokiarchaeota archaeon]
MTVDILQFSFEIVFPVVLLALIAVIFLTSIKDKPPKGTEYMSTKEYMKEWMRSHGQAHDLDRIVEEIQQKGNPFGSIWTPIVVKNAKIFGKMGLTPNKVSVMSLLITFLIFYLTVIAGAHQPGGNPIERLTFGLLAIPAALLVLYAGITDGVDGALATLQKKKTKAGGWADGVLDRISDVLLLVSLIPGGYLVVLDVGLDFKWLAWTNIFLVFLYEYSRAKHFELGMVKIKALIAERPVRIILQSGALWAFGVNCLIDLIVIWASPVVDPGFVVYYTVVLNWVMVYFNMAFFAIMVICTVIECRFVWAELKQMDAAAKETAQ